MNRNAGLLFYKEYFDKLSFNSSGEVLPTSFSNQDLFKLDLGSYNVPQNPLSSNSIELTTLYPGLLIGSGYSHEIGGVKFEDELKLGFFFDYTTGLPCIPSSSVKGVLRDAFEKNGGRYIEYILGELSDLTRKPLEQEIVDDAKLYLKDNLDQILEDKKTSLFVENVFEGKNLPIYNRDIFFDAFPVKSLNKDGRFLANDYITHHENPLKNPNPVQFMKILPQVTFRFDFRLTNNIMPAKLKLELFRQILLDLGIGAKTNVGYGQFSE